MRDLSQTDTPLDLDLYARSQGRISTLKSQLPVGSVENLAREVIRRMSERDEEFSIEAPSDAQIEHLCHALLSDDHLAGAAVISEVRSVGASIEAVYLKYLARAARKLGDWWDDDRVSFPMVTLGTSRMYAIMRAMRHQMPLSAGSISKSAVFLSVPNETHTLGVRMATDLFRNEGWDIDLRIDEDHDALVAHVAQVKPPIVGISAGGAHALDALSRLIVALRIRVPATALFVSGQITEEAADAIELFDIDGIAGEIDTARALMRDLWAAHQG